MTDAERVPVDNPEFNNLLRVMSTALRQHRTVPRGDGRLGNVCPDLRCSEAVFLTRGAAQDHQSFEVLRAIRVAVDDERMGDDPEADAQAIADLTALLGLAPATGQAEAVTR